MKSLTKFGAHQIKKQIDSYWSATSERYSKYGMYLSTWVEQEGESITSPYVVRSNMINGLPPSPEVLDRVNHFLKIRREQWQ